MKYHISLAAFAAAIMVSGAALAQDFVQSGSADTLPQTEGKALYNAVCSGCHMPDGMGAVGAGKYPPLAGNIFVDSKEGVTQWIIKGHKGMPPLGMLMDDTQISELVNYVRHNLGDNNFEGDMTPAEVADVRNW